MNLKCQTSETVEKLGTERVVILIPPLAGEESLYGSNRFFGRGVYPASGGAPPE